VKKMAKKTEEYTRQIQKYKNQYDENKFFNYYLKERKFNDYGDGRIATDVTAHHWSFVDCKHALCPPVYLIHAQTRHSIRSRVQGSTCARPRTNCKGRPDHHLAPSFNRRISVYLITTCVSGQSAPGVYKVSVD
jgi:hypothetical protein